MNEIIDVCHNQSVLSIQTNKNKNKKHVVVCRKLFLRLENWYKLYSHRMGKGLRKNRKEKIIINQIWNFNQNMKHETWNIKHETGKLITNEMVKYIILKSGKPQNWENYCNLI